MCDKSSDNRNCRQQNNFITFLAQRQNKARHQEKVVWQRNGQRIGNKETRTRDTQKTLPSLRCKVRYIMFLQCFPEPVNKGAFIISVGAMTENDVAEDRHGCHNKTINDQGDRTPLDAPL